MASEGRSLLDEILQIKDRSIFSYIPEDELSKLVKQCRIESFKAGDAFLKQGEENAELPIVLDGAATVYNTLATGREFVLGDVQAGRSVDFASALLDTPWHQNAKMKTDGRILWVNQHALLTQLRRDKANFRYLELMTTEPSIRDFTRAFRYLEDIDRADLRAFLLGFELIEYRENEVIQDQDKQTKHVFVLREGRVQVAQYNSTVNEDIRVREIVNHELFANQQLSRDQRISLFKYTANSKASVWRAPLDSYLEITEKYEFLRKMLDRSESEAIKEAKFSAKNSASDFTPLSKQTPGEEGGSSGAEDSEEEDGFDYDPSADYKRKFPIILQRDQMECAAASLGMICKYYGIDIGLRYFRNAIGVGPEGASMYGIATASEKVGFLSRGVKIEIAEFDDIKLPAITNQGYHFVVVYDVKGDHLILGDPAIGLRRVNRADFAKDWTGVVLLFNLTPEFFKNKAEKESFEVYKELFSSYRPYFLQILVVSALINVLALAGPLFSQMIIDRVLTTGDSDLLHIMGAGVFLVFVLSTLAGAIRRYFSAFVSRKLDVEMATQFIRHLMRLPPKFFAARRSGDTLSRMDDIQSIRDFVTGQGIEVMLDIVMLIVYTIAIFLYQVKLGIAFVALSAIFLAITKVVGDRLQRQFADFIKHYSDAQSLLVESIKNINTFKIFTAEISSRWKWEDHYARSGNHRFKMANLQNVFSVFVEVLYKGAPYVMLFYGANEVLAKHLSIGEVIALSSIFSMALMPLLNIAGVFTQFQRVIFGLNRLNDIFTTTPEETLETFVPIAIGDVKGHIQISDVSFRYGNEESPMILNNLTLEIHPGRKVAFVGRSGSGKTTLVQLISRLYEPTNGRLLLDGNDMRMYPLSQVRSIVAAVTQDTKLIVGSILDNIALGDQFPDMQRAIRASELANADEFIRNLPGGYFTPLFEDGAGLSGGQKQRVAIARALYRDPKILIMDEATAALDSESEAAINAAMPEICKGRTVIMIAHRLNTIQNCDKIFLIDGGSVIEEGRHDELLRLNGAYTQLVRASL